MQKALMSIRISPEAKALLLKLAQHLGLSQTAVLELAIRRLAEQEHLR
jgi:predicted transcriptional regulator